MKENQGAFIRDAIKSENHRKKCAELARIRDSNKGGVKNVAKDVDDFIDSHDDYCGHN